MFVTALCCRRQSGHVLCAEHWSIACSMEALQHAHQSVYDQLFSCTNMPQPLHQPVYLHTSNLVHLQQSTQLLCLSVHCLQRSNNRIKTAGDPALSSLSKLQTSTSQYTAVKYSHDRRCFLSPHKQDIALVLTWEPQLLTAKRVCTCA